MPCRVLQLLSRPATLSSASLWMLAQSLSKRDGVWVAMLYVFP
jgi:hypothetical protein